MNDGGDRGFTPENVFAALLTIKEATEMGFARVEADMAALGASLRSEFGVGFAMLENRLGAKIDGLERRLIRVDDRLSAIENQNFAGKLADHEWRISRLEGPR